MRKWAFTVFVCLCGTVISQNTIKIWNNDDVRTAKWKSELIVFQPQTKDTSGISVIICPGGSYY